MKQIAILLAIILTMSVLAGCANTAGELAESSAAQPQTQASEGTSPESSFESNSPQETEVEHMEQTGWSKAVPSSYMGAATNQGSITRIEYDSRDYAGNDTAVTKTAHVYTPYGYRDPL